MKVVEEVLYTEARKLLLRIVNQACKKKGDWRIIAVFRTRARAQARSRECGAARGI